MHIKSTNNTLQTKNKMMAFSQVQVYLFSKCSMNDFFALFLQYSGILNLQSDGRNCFCALL